MPIVAIWAGLVVCSVPYRRRDTSFQQERATSYKDLSVKDVRTGRGDRFTVDHRKKGGPFHHARARSSGDRFTVHNSRDPQGYQQVWGGANRYADGSAFAEGLEAIAGRLDGSTTTPPVADPSLRPG